MKDQNAPKRPLTGFFRYAQSIREEVQASSGLKGIKVTPLLSQRWKELSEEEKDVYNVEFRSEMAGWKEQYAAYKTTQSYKDFQAKKSAKKLKDQKPKDTNAPKRPLTSYILFCSDVRDEVRSALGGEDATFGQIGAKMSSMWREMSDDDKQYYTEKAAEAKAEYAQVLAEYRDSAAYAHFQEKVATFKQLLKDAKKAGKAAQKAAKKVQKKKIMKKKK
jgi:structure-specific recognition protein 1